MAGGFVFVGKSRLRKIRKDARKLKKLETKKKSPPGGSGEWSPRSQKIKYEPLLSPRDETDNISVCSSDSAISSGSEDFLPLIDLRPESIVFTMPFGPFKKSKEQEEKKRQEEEKERQRLEEEERLRKEEEERLRKEEEEREERLRQEEEERKRKEEEEERLAEEQRLEEERKRVEAEEKKNKLFGGFTFIRKKSPKDEKADDSMQSNETEQEMNNAEQGIDKDSKDGKTEDDTTSKETDFFSFGFMAKLRELTKSKNDEEEENKGESATEEVSNNEKNAKETGDDAITEKKEENDIFSFNIFKRLGRRNSEERRQREEEEAKQGEEEERKRQEEERAREEEEERRNEEEDKGVFGIALFRSKFFKPKEEKPEQEPLNAPVVEAKEAEVQQQNDVAQSQTVEEKVEEEEKKDEEDTKSLDSGIEIHKNGIDTDEQDGQKNQKVEKAKVAGEERDCTEMLCCTIM